MRRSSLLAVVLAVLTAVALLFPAGDANAIPAFARKYNASCTLCHAPVPRLKAFGEAFAARGFRMVEPGEPAEDAEPPRGTTPTGDRLLQLPDRVPLAVRIEGHGAWTDEGDVDASFDTPYVAKVLSGGPISPKISYYAYFIIEQGGVEGLEDAYLHFSKVFDSNVDLLFGQFQVSDPLFKRELRLERADYEIYKVRVGDASANLTYDRGLMFLGSAPGDVDVVFQIVNGNGIPHGEFDNDSNKNLALRLSRDFGAVRLGLFGYTGKEENELGITDAIRYWGPDLTIQPHPDWVLNLQYLERTDDDPFFEGPGAREVTTEGGFAELLFFPKGQDGRWSVAALYNNVDSDDPEAVRDDVSLGLGWLAARNIRVLTEVGRDLENDANRMSLGVVAAF